MINALALLSNNILIVCTLEFRFSSKITGLFWELGDFLMHSFGGKIRPKAIDNNSVVWNNCSLFEINLF